MKSLDEQIRDGELRREAEYQEWREKHIPVYYEGKIYWLTIMVPASIQAVLDHLPKEREDADIPRPRQIKARLSEEEWESFDILIKASGLPQGEYIRGMILNGSVEVTQTSLVDSKALEMLIALSAEIGKVAGLLRKTVIVNKEFAVLDHQDKMHLEHSIRSLRQLQTRLQTLAETIHGNLQT